VFYITLYDTGYSTESLFGLKLPEIKLLSAEKLGLIGCFYALGVVICLEQGADLHMAQLMPLPLSFLQAGCPSCHPTNSVKAPKK